MMNNQKKDYNCKEKTFYKNPRKEGTKEDIQDIRLEKQSNFLMNNEH